jgi:large repetitive protein
MLKRSNIGGLILAVFGLLWFAVAVQAQVVDTICFNSTPPAFLNNSLPEGSNGVYTYEWQDSTASGSWQMAQGANTDTSYQSGALTEDTYFRRKSVSLVCGEEAYSNEVMIMVYDELDTNQLVQSAMMAL